MKKSILSISLMALAVLFGCEENNNEVLETVNQQGGGHYLSSSSTLVTILNAGFESSWSDWNDSDPSSISGDANSGSKSAKVTGSGGGFTQDVSVTSNTEYTLSFYVKGSWRAGVRVNGVKTTRSGSSSSWKEESVTFNSGSATTVTVLGEYVNGDVRYDDFSLVGGDVVDPGNGGGETAAQLTISGIAASSDDGNVPSNTTDGSLDTRWSANGEGQWIRYDLGSVKNISEVKLAWFKGDQRSSTYEIKAGNSTSNLSVIYSGASTGSSLSLENHTFSNVSARYIQVVGYGNSSNTWNSITEAEIYGTDGEGEGENPEEPEIPTPSGDYPTDIIPSLTDWKITLPVDSNGNDSSGASNVDSRNKNAYEIKDDNLIGYEYSPYFNVRDGEVVFRAHCAGATTSGSKYPRCELRQRVGGGDNYWSVNDYQKLVTELRVTHLPVQKPEVSMVQIHGPNDEPLRVQYHASNGLYIVWNETNKDYFKDDVPYTLGQQLKVTVVVNNGDITCTVLNMDTNKSYTKTWTSNDSTGYFKVGCYTQSSVFLSEFKSGYDDEPANAYGEITVSSIDLTETY